MPTYEYKCTVCAHQFEAEQRMSDSPLTDCPQCQTGKVRRVISGGAGIAFKGTGFYINDSKAPKVQPKSENCQACANTACPSKN